MKNKSGFNKPTTIPVSPALNAFEGTQNKKKNNYLKTRLLRICFYAVLVAVAICFIAKFLVTLINVVTNLAFFGKFDLSFHSPAGNHLGWWVIIIPAIGGVVVGLMALYGSKAIRGHGIPEAMEQILVNQSKIKPSITFLKPISSAIAIGTGGPFGAEGPIIATGGALGSTLGQLLKITSSERKVILAAGATAGMSAIFGTPIAAVFLAIELLLFEFSPKAILPVALACITGAAGHHLLFEAGPVFEMPELATPSNQALAIYSFIGLLIGFLSMALTKAVYLIEDWFEKLPIHWTLWPAIGGLAVGLVGYFYPHTLGVGYDNITGLLSGNLSLQVVLALCFFKFLSWAIALGSGTSGGTLAPLLTIGGASGSIASALILSAFPDCGISVPMGALIGMSAMFAGASRAYLTSVTFALEATMQSHALLPLLGACTASYLVSFFLMENTIMTEKIARRGVITPDSYEPDILQRVTVSQVMRTANINLSDEMTIGELKQYLAKHQGKDDTLAFANSKKEYCGTMKLTSVYSANDNTKVNELLKTDTGIIRENDILRGVVEMMARHKTDVLPVINNGQMIGLVSYADILSVYKQHVEQNETKATHISLKRQQMKLALKRRARLRSKREKV